MPEQGELTQEDLTEFRHMALTLATSRRPYASPHEQIEVAIVYERYLRTGDNIGKPEEDDEEDDEEHGEEESGAAHEPADANEPAPQQS